MKTKIKWRDSFWLLTAILLFSLIFFTAQLIIQENREGSPIIFEKLDTNQIITSNSNKNFDFHTVVASKTGNFYYYPSCSRAKLIKDSNKIWFDSTKSADMAGYFPASGCLPQK